MHLAVEAGRSIVDYILSVSHLHVCPIFFSCYLRRLPLENVYCQSLRMWKGGW